MNYTITRGNYEKMGLLRERDRATFTFAGEKEDACFVVLVDEKEEQEIRVLVPPEYCFGSLHLHDPFHDRGKSPCRYRQSADLYSGA